MRASRRHVTSTGSFLGRRESSWRAPPRLCRDDDVVNLREPLRKLAAARTTPTVGRPFYRHATVRRPPLEALGVLLQLLLAVERVKSRDTGHPSRTGIATALQANLHLLREPACDRAMTKPIACRLAGDKDRPVRVDLVTSTSNRPKGTPATPGRTPPRFLGRGVAVVEAHRISATARPEGVTEVRSASKSSPRS